MMKKTLLYSFGGALLFALTAALGFGQVANDLILTQRKSDNSGNIQRNVSPVASGFLTFDASKIPTSPSGITYVSSLLSSPAYAATGTGGTGYVQFANQASAPSTPTSAGRLYWDSSNRLSWIGTNGYTRTFDGTANTANRIYTLPDYAGTVGLIGAASQTGAFYATTFNGLNGQAITGDASGAWSVAANGTNQNITLTPSGTGFISVVGAGIRLDNTAKSLAAWGVSGPAFSTSGRTYTDTSSSGTVATAVGSNLAVPTFAASSATTFTNTANLYIAGDVAAGTNVTLTNSYGLWNVGKTRLDGKLSITDTTASTSTTTGSATFAGGIGVAGNLWVGGDFNLSGNNLHTNYRRTVTTAYSGSSYFTGATEKWFLGLREDSTDNFYLYNPTTASNAFSISSAASNVAFLSTTEATTGGAGSITAAGGIYAAKKIVSGTAVFDGSSAAATLTGGAGNMTITAGTGNSRTLTLQTTTSGGTATNAVVFGNTQSATFNGPIIQKVSALTYASPTSVDVTLGNVYTVTTVNATGSVTFNASAGGTAGQSMTILITNDATSAKTITFGTNFLSTGTLTASAASRHTSITFTSDGTNWYETGRAVLTN